MCWMCWKWVQKSFPFNVLKAYLKYCLLVVSDILGTSQINFLITYFLQAKLLFLIYRYAFSIIDKCQAKKNGRLIMMIFWMIMLMMMMTTIRWKYFHFEQHRICRLRLKSYSISVFIKTRTQKCNYDVGNLVIYVCCNAIKSFHPKNSYTQPPENVFKKEMN